MKGKKLKKYLAALLASLMVAALLAGCGGNASTTAPPATDNQTASDQTAAPTAAPTDTPAPTPTPLAPEDVTFYLWGTAPNNLDNVISKFESETKDTLNMTIHFDFTDLADFSQKIQLRLSAGESVDACYDAQWMTLMSYIASGTYTDLSSYFNNPDYPGLQAAFDQNYLQNNMLGTDKIYAIPFTQTYGTASLIYIRGDLRKKWGCPPVTSLDTYEQYLAACVQNEPNMIPYAAATNSANVGNIYSDVSATTAKTGEQAGIWASQPIVGQAGLYADLSIQNYQVQGCWIHLEPQSVMATELPAPYNKIDLGAANMAEQFYNNGWLDKDFLSVTDAHGQFTSGAAASMWWDTSNYAAISQALLSSVPDAQLEVWCPNPAYAQGLTGLIPGQYQAWNFLAIPVTTPKDKVDRIMAFYDWMFSSNDNHNLFELGVEGQDYTLNADGSYQVPDGVDPATVYNLAGYQLTWNPHFINTNAGFPAEVQTAIANANNPATYYDPLLSGFTFQQDNVQTQLANPDIATLNAEIMNIQYGLSGDPAAAYAKVDAELAADTNLQTDLQTIKAEYVNQMNAYLAQRKIQDQANGITDPTE